MTKPVKIAVGLLAVTVALCAVVLLRPKGEGVTARITQDGEVLYEIDLTQAEGPQTIHIPGTDGAYNTAQVEHGRIRMLEASCPDQVCVNQGWISDSALPIVCLPNKVIIEIAGGEGELDVLVK